MDVSWPYEDEEEKTNTEKWNKVVKEMDVERKARKIFHFRRRRHFV